MGRMLPLITPSDHLEAALRPCWYCRWWGGQVYGIHGLCTRPDGSPVQASPRTGCAFFEREPGVDDDGWEPFFATRVRARVNTSAFCDRSGEAVPAE
jgi:hypothetical protein